MLEQLIPNVMVKIPKLIQSILETFQMMGWSGSISFVLGLFFGVVLIVTRKEGIMECHPVYWVLDKIINILRSIPFIILVPATLFLSRAIMGTGIGVKGAIIPLIIGTVPFFSRQIELALAEVEDVYKRQIPGPSATRIQGRGAWQASGNYPGRSRNRANDIQLVCE